MVEKEQEDTLSRLLESLGDKCKRVLELWQLSYSMKEIAVEMAYKSDGVARKKKRLCMKKLLEILDEKPEPISCKMVSFNILPLPSIFNNLDDNGSSQN